LQNSSKKKKQKKRNKPTYKDIESMVEYLVKVKSDKFTFDHYDRDDIGQEIRIICLKVLGHFDFEKVKEDKWINFFGRCVDNALRNLKRDKYIRPASTCSKECRMLHGEDKDISKVCKKWKNRQANNERKMTVKNPISIDIVGDITYNYFENSVMTNDIKRFLIDNIDEELRPTLLKLINGTKTKLSKKKVARVQISVKELLRG